MKLVVRATGRRIVAPEHAALELFPRWEVAGAALRFLGERRQPAPRRAIREAEQAHDFLAELHVREARPRLSKRPTATSCRNRVYAACGLATPIESSRLMIAAPIPALATALSTGVASMNSHTSTCSQFAIEAATAGSGLRLGNLSW